MEQHSQTQLIEPLISTGVVQQSVSYAVPGGKLMLVDRLGRGGFADVYGADFSAHDGAMPFTAEPQYAAKVMGWGPEHAPTVPMEVVTAPNFKPEEHIPSRRGVVEMATKECRLMTLEHPHVVPLAPFAGIDESRNRLYYTMPYAYQTFQSWLTKPKRTSYETVLILSQVADGLQCAHDKGGVVHRDVKPGNILLIRDEKAAEGFRAAIGDFGIAVEIDPKTPAEQAYKKKPLGTDGYVPFEQYTEEGAVPASDQFALGVTAYQAVTGTPPYTGNNQEIARQIASFNMSPPGFEKQTGRANSITASFLEPVILRAIAKRPEDRHASVAAFGDALGEALAAAGAECRRQASIQHDRAAFAANSGQSSLYYEKSLAFLEEALSANPWDLTAMLQKSQSLQHLGRQDEAAAILNTIARTPARNAADNVVCGNVLDYLGDHIHARQCYTKAHAESCEDLARTAEDAHKTAEAIALYTQAIDGYRQVADSIGINDALAVKLGALQRRVDKLTRGGRMLVPPKFSLVAVL